MSFIPTKAELPVFIATAAVAWCVATAALLNIAPILRWVIRWFA